jgi:hypothetical protein
MGMRIDQAGYDESPFEIDRICALRRVVRGTSGITYVDESAILDGNRFCPGLSLVRSEYLRAGQDQISALRTPAVSTRRAARQQNDQRSHERCGSIFRVHGCLQLSCKWLDQPLVLNPKPTRFYAGAE